MNETAWIALGSLWFFSSAALAGGGLKLALWLGEKFADVKEAQAAALKDHEKEDERRHTENLERFRDIAVALNGRHHQRGNVRRIASHDLP